MNYVMKWIQEDGFNLLHRMWGANFKALVYCTVCTAQIAQYARWKVYKYVENRLFCKKEWMYWVLALHAINWLYCRICHNCRIFLQNIDISDRLRFKSAQYCRFVWKFWTGMSVNGDAEQEVVSHHPHCLVCAAASVLPFNPSQCVQHYKLYNRPPCIVLYLCFWFRPGISQSMGFEPVTNVPPDRAASVLSACQELEKAAWNKLDPRQSVTPCLCNYLPSIVFSVAREWQQL